MRRAPALLPALGSLVLASACADAGGDPAPPSILLISLDTVRADHTGFLGYERDTTPYLDRLAQESIVFERAYSTSSFTQTSAHEHVHGALPKQHAVTGERKLSPASRCSRRSSAGPATRPSPSTTRAGSTSASASRAASTTSRVTSTGDGAEELRAPAPAPPRARALLPLPPPFDAHGEKGGGTSGLVYDAPGELAPTSSPTPASGSPGSTCGISGTAHTNRARPRWRRSSRSTTRGSATWTASSAVGSRAGSGAACSTARC